MIIKFNYENRELLDLARQIRTQVFVDEQGVDQSLEFEFDENCNHYLLYFENEAVATARRRETEKGIKLERFAVRLNKRGMNFGQQILEFILNDIGNTDKIVYLNAQIQVVDFYKKYGFIVDSEVFTEAGIEHYRMKFIGKRENNIK